jgi:hypothetical protein
MEAGAGVLGGSAAAGGLVAKMPMPHEDDEALTDEESEAGSEDGFDNDVEATEDDDDDDDNVGLPHKCAWVKHIVQGLSLSFTGTGVGAGANGGSKALEWDDSPMASTTKTTKNNTFRV